MRKVSSIASLLFTWSFGGGGAACCNKKFSNAVRSCSGLSSTKPSGPLVQYRKLIEQGKLQHDPYQERVALALENLFGRLDQYERDMEEYHVKLANWEKSREDEQRKLLKEEAQQQQEQGGLWSSVKKHRSNLVERWMFR